MTAPSAPTAVDSITSSSVRRKTSRPPVAGTDTLSPALETLLQLLRAPVEPSDDAQLPALLSARRAVATALDALASPPPRGPLTDALLAAADALAAHPAGALASDVAATPPQSSSWQASLVRLFAAPAWQTPDLRALADQPAWLWAVYARHLFAAPAFFYTADQENQWAAHILTHLDPLVRMFEGNRGSSSVRTVAQLVVSAAAVWPAVGSDDQLRRRQQGVGRLRALLAPRLPAFQSDAQATPPASPLRVGLICDATVATPGIFDSTHLKTLLDPERIELSVYTDADLPGDIATQVDTLRLAQLDAVVFAGDLTAAGSPLAALAVHRVAPRQFATALCPQTTGLPEIDVFLADSTAVPSAHTEQLAVMPAALAFDSSVEESPLTRTDFGLPEDGPLFAATVHPAHLTSATRAHWQALLATDPQARLVVLPDTSGPVLDLLLADLVREFGERLILSGNAPLPALALAALLRVINTYVPSSAPGDQLNRNLAQQLGLAVPDAPERVDALAFADALTFVLETACRTPGEPLVAPPVSADFTTRHEEGNHLVAFGRADRAVVYLLAAVDSPQAGPDVWHDLALALHANGQPGEAIQALETSVRLAPDRLDAWLLLADWASDYGHTELVAEITGVVQLLAPADPRVAALAERIAV